MTLEQRNNTGFGAPILQVAENPPIINSQPSTNGVPHLRYQPTLDSHLQIQLTSDRVVLQSLLSKKEKKSLCKWTHEVQACYCSRVNCTEKCSDSSATSHTFCPHHLRTPIQAESRQTDRKISMEGNSPCLFLITSRVTDGVIRSFTTNFSKSTEVKNEKSSKLNG